MLSNVPEYAAAVWKSVVWFKIDLVKLQELLREVVWEITDITTLHVQVALYLEKAIKPFLFLCLFELNEQLIRHIFYKSTISCK